MGKGLAMRKIILPQAIKNILPALGNEFVTLIKETSIFMYLGIAELMYAATIVRTSTYSGQGVLHRRRDHVFLPHVPDVETDGTARKEDEKADAR
ncbi:MAG: hypothetical protein MZU97_13755 [Bacillus subtilis]|nr:hypothetical protein [Bacillus subtilis]